MLKYPVTQATKFQSIHTKEKENPPIFWQLWPKLQSYHPRAANNTVSIYASVPKQEESGAGAKVDDYIMNH